MPDHNVRPSDENAPPRRFREHPIWSRWTGLILVLAVILTLYLGAKWLSGAPMTDILAEAAFFVIIFTIGFLKVIYPSFGRVVEQGLAYYLFGTFLLLAAFGPVSIFFIAIRWGTSELGPSGRTGVLVVATAAWALLLGVVAIRKLRTKFFEGFSTLGWGAPILVSVNFIFVSVILFGSFGHLTLCGSGPCTLVEGGSRIDASLDTFLNVFLWEVLDAVPFLDAGDDVPGFDPLSGGPPLAGLGWLIVLFKVAVIIPGFGAFAAYRSWLKSSRERPPPDPEWPAFGW